ncbi:hypothetical protein MMC11_002414 [Xylographa trunciseda]|nr:hypothetical protein [Xylographa trunciseda]
MSRLAGRLLGKHKANGVVTASQDGGSAPTTNQIPQEKTGLFELTPPSVEEEGLVDIIAVHGLRGHAFDTWTCNDDTGTPKLWLRDFLPQQISARVMSYGYNSAAAFTTSVAGIEDFALMLLNEIRFKRSTIQEKARPIIFVCHSLGGIVVKKALILAHEDVSTHSNILQSVRGLCFMGVPHRGSDAAWWADYVTNIFTITTFGTSTNPQLLVDLTKESTTLMKISTQFIHRSKDLLIYTFYELDKIKGMNTLIVDKHSALLRLTNETSVPVQANHRTICKFSSVNSQAYQLVSNCIIESSNKIKETTALETSQAKNLTSETEALGTQELSKDELACLTNLYQSSPEQARSGIALRTEGTCRWILEDSMYHDWLMPDTSKLLWISGDPGCGKSVLSTFIVDYIKDSLPDSTVCYFFCDDKVGLQRTAVSLLRSILHQLLCAKRALLKHVLPQFLVKGAAMFTEVSLLWDALITCLDDPISGSVICIIDALDECENIGRTWFLASLVKYARRAILNPVQHSTKFLLTSRPEIAIADKLAIATIKLKIEDQLDYVSVDIKLVVHERISELASLTNCSQQTQHWLLQRLISNADRTFLWVSLVLDMLKESFQASQKAFEDLLGSLPYGLEDTYLKILERIPEDRRFQAQTMLQIIVAAYKPLTLNELNLAWSIRSEDKTEDDLLDQSQPNMTRTIHGLVGCFVRIIDGKTYLIHQTAKEFLVHDHDSDISLDPISLYWYQFSLREAHLALARRCLWYLLLEESEKVTHGEHLEVADTNHEHPKSFLGCIDIVCPWHEDELNYDTYVQRHGLLQYCRSYRKRHFHEARAIADSETVRCAFRYKNPRFTRFKAWVHLLPGGRDIIFSSLTIGHQAIVRQGHPRPWEEVQRLPYIDRFWTVGSARKHFRILRTLEKVSKSSIDEIIRISPSSSRRLFSTVGHDFEQVKAVTLNDEAEKDTPCDQTSLMHMAANGGHEKLLLARIRSGAVLNSVDQAGRTPLHLAILRGHEKTVRALIESGAKLNCSDQSGMTPLHLAIHRGHEKMILALIKSGANPNCSDQTGTKPLHSAARNRQTRNMLALNENGAGVDLVDRDMESSLHLVARAGHAEAVLLLIQNGAQRDMQNTNGHTPLHLAAMEGHTKVVLELVQNGAQLNIEDRLGKTPLFLAHRYGQPETAVTLMKEGGCFHIQTGKQNRKRSTATHLLPKVASSGDIPTLLYLLESGADVNSRDGWNGRTAIQEVICYSRYEDDRAEVILSLLIRRHASLEIKDKNGDTALHLAITYNRIRIVPMLLAAGADKATMNGLNCNALKWAEGKGGKDMIPLLQ